jgi:hypothetical protein
MTRPTADDVRRVLDYDANTGIFTWRHRRPASNFNARFAGKQAGSMYGRAGEQYRRIEWNGGKRYFASHLAWLLVVGEWPRNQLDHINLDKDDNRIANLRAATPSQNMCNRPIFKNNTSGAKGVYYHKRDGRWYASIRVNNKSIHLGSFLTRTAAAAAYAVAAVEHHGEFGRAA